MLNLIKNCGSYEVFKIKSKGIFPSSFAEVVIENKKWVFSTFLVLLGIGFIFGQFSKAIPVLKSSKPWLSDGYIQFPFMFFFMYVWKHFTSFFCVVFSHFGIWDNNFETFINPMIFHQIRLPRIVLNVELNELSKSAIDFNF